jgi:virginiamycin B lyase
LTKKKIKAPSSSSSHSRPLQSKKTIIYAAMGIIVVVALAIVLFMDNNSGNNNNNDLSNNKLVESSRIAAIDKFENQFCGNNANPNSNQYVSEYVLPSRCEMPLGIAVDNNASKVWYISTKNGVLGSYSIKENRFDQEHTIPIWKSRQNPIYSSQVWTVKIDRQKNIWFTDEKQNSIWRYNILLKTFEFFNIPGISESFGTTYPVSLDFDSSGNIYFVGIRSTSLWFGNITEMKNGTSDGISQIPIPLQGFAGIDPDLISTGSLVVDENNNSVWLSMLAFARKGLIFKYDINSKTFEVFNLPPDLRSPVGITLENNNNNSDLWITDHGTSIFYKLNYSDRKITKFVTSQASPRIFGSNGTSEELGASAPSAAYTLPYWINKGSNGSIWFNEHTGNKIAVFNPVNMTLIEYWIPTQNALFGQCQPTNSKNCGIANILQFSVGNNNEVWFSEWSENKIGRVDTDKELPFSISSSEKEITIAKGKSAEIRLNLKTTSSSPSSDQTIKMIKSGTFTATGALGNSTGSFSEEFFSIAPGNSKQISFIFTPSLDLKSGEYTLMVGAENNAISYLNAIKINII